MLAVLRFKKSLLGGVLDGGESEVFLQKGRLDRFMESIESVTTEVQPPSADEPPIDTGSPVVPENVVPEELPDETAARPAQTLAEPLAQLVEQGVGFLRQLAAALPADAGSPASPRRPIETRQDADGSTYLAIPLPSRDAVVQIAEGLTALLRSLRP
jgi:hypothetical protein